MVSVSKKQAALGVVLGVFSTLITVLSPGLSLCSDFFWFILDGFLVIRVGGCSLSVQGCAPTRGQNAEEGEGGIGGAEGMHLKGLSRSLILF